MSEKKYIYDNSGKKREAVEINCDLCKKLFLKCKRFLTDKNYCSVKCRGDSRKNRLKTKCTLCGVEFERKVSSFKKNNSGLFFCSRECKDTAQRIENGFKEIQPQHYGDIYEEKYRIKAFKEYGNYCECCGYDKEKVLQVHHIDRDRSNNKKENLIVLCRNCHGEIHTGYAILAERKLEYVQNIEDKMVKKDVVGEIQLGV